MAPQLSPGILFRAASILPKYQEAHQREMDLQQSLDMQRQAGASRDERHKQEIDVREVEKAALEARHEDEIRAIKQDYERRIHECRLNAEAEMKKLEVRKQALHSQPTPEPTKGKLIVPVPRSVKRKAENDAAVFESPVEDSFDPHGRPSTPCKNDKGDDAKKQLVRRVPNGVSPGLRPLYNKATIDFAEVMEARQEKIRRLQAKEVQRQVLCSERCRASSSILTVIGACNPLSSQMTRRRRQRRTRKRTTLKIV